MRKTFVSTIAFVSAFVCLLQLGPVSAFAAAADAIAENTKPPLQITNREELNIVVQINSSSTIPNGISKQVFAVKNLHDQYAALGMKSGIDYKIAVVFRADGSQFLLTDEAYDLKVKEPHPSGNPSRAILELLSTDGVEMYECGVAMQLKGYKPNDLLAPSRIVVTGIGAIIDFQKSGYLLMTP